MPRDISGHYKDHSSIVKQPDKQPNMPIRDDLFVFMCHQTKPKSSKQILGSRSLPNAGQEADDEELST